MKIRQIPRGVKASFAFLLASVISKAIAYITTPIFTRLLTPDEYGHVAVFLTWLQILGIPAMFCLSYGVFNNGMIDYEDRRDEYSYSMLVLSNVITTINLVVILLLYSYISPFIDLDFAYILLMFMIFYLQPAYSFWLARQRYELKYKTALFWSAVISVIAPLCAILYIIWGEIDHAKARIFGGEIPLLLIYVGFYIYIIKQSHNKLDISFWRGAVIFNLPLIPHYLSTFLLGSMDRLMISKIVGDEETAYYTVAYSIASVATIIWTAINSSLIPYTYEKCRENNYFAINKVTIPLLFLFFFACVCVILLAPELISIIATQAYLDAIYVIPPVVGGVFFQILYFIYANIVYYHKRPRYIMYSSVSATLLNFILNYYFIPIYGYIAAGYTTLFSYILQAILDYYAMRITVNKNVYDTKTIIFISLLVILIALTSQFLYYNLSIIRYVIIIIIAIGIIVYRKKISYIIRDIKK